MSHIHIPDGVLPTWLWVSGWIVTLGIVWLAARISERDEVRRKVPLLGAVSALVLVAMTTEVVPLAYHVNLTVVAGALLGPWMSILSAFVVQLILALLGHGGVTVIGLNTLMIAGEMVIGWALVRGFVRLLGRRRVGWASGISTVLTLALTTTLLVGIVAVAGAGPATERETGALDASSLTLRSPFSGGVISLGLFGDGHAEEPSADTTTHESGLSVGRFAAVVYTLGPIGWLLEALVTAGVLRFVARVRPNLVFFGALAEHTHAIPGDEVGRH